MVCPPSPPPPATHSPSGRTVQLSVSGQQARIVPDEHDDGWVLEIGGMIQSHVDLQDPTRIRYEYLARMAALLDHAFPQREPISVLHLGAGALTLPRYVQATRPGSAQVTVELERELPSLVIAELPLPAGTELEVVIGDARAELAELSPRRFDAVVLDIYTGEGEVEHLTGTDFYAELMAALTERGLLLVNVGDDTGHRFYALQAAAVEQAATGAGLTGAWTLADANLIERREAGNLVLAAGPALGSTDTDQLDALRADLLGAGPHPAAVLNPADTADLTGRISG